MNPPTPPEPLAGVPAPARWSMLDRLIATTETLEHVAELGQDTQAAQVDPLQREWLKGYRQACRDVLDAHALHVAAATDYRARGGAHRG